MMLSEIVRLFDLMARLFGFLGASLVLAVSARGTLSYLREGPSFDTVSDLGLLPLIVPAQMLLAAWVLLNVLKPNSRPLLLVLSLAFAGSFVVAYGRYFLLAPDTFYVGVGNLLYLLAALFALGARLSAVGVQLDEERT